MIKNTAIFSLMLFIIGALLLCGCRSGQDVKDEAAPLKVGALSMMTVLPLHVADREGLFKAQGINVEIVPFRSQIDRDTALKTGQIDCIIEDIYSAPILNKDEDLIKVVAVSPVRSYMFAIVASKESSINNTADLKRVEIASSMGNIIEYVTDQMCSAGGIEGKDIRKNSIASMPLRLELMNQGKIEAATFSRPLSDLAVMGGGRIICDDSRASLLGSSIMVAGRVLDSRPKVVQQFLKAWSEATDRITAGPDHYRNLLVDIASISSEIADRIAVPGFDRPRLPTRDEYQAKMEWNINKGNLSQAVEYEDIVTDSYLP